MEARRLTAGIVTLIFVASGCTSATHPTPIAGAPGMPVPSSSFQGSRTPMPTTPTTPPTCPSPWAPTTDAHGDVSRVIIDYVDVLEFGGRTYAAGKAVPVAVSALDRVVGQIRCTLSAYQVDPYYQMRDGDAAFLPVGTDIYAVKGTPVDQAVAARHDGVMYLYQAMPPG